MTYLDIQCAACGEFHHNGPHDTAKCPQCGGVQIVVTPHDYDIDRRFKEERQAPEDEISE